MLALAETAEKPRPTVVHQRPHPMPGHEWAVSARMPRKVYDHFYRRERDGWLVRATDSADDADCVFISTPDAMDAEDFMAVPTTTARQLAMAILAACDRADSIRHGVANLDAWRTKKVQLDEGDEVT
ncbi:hypothetical protein ACPCTG_32125 [Streptomyces pseudogriseolus]|uniref:hypothetical protein n=1 Tax=Streptomyces pseudogriseolus TaxID=36817 RepID=UPI003FA2D40E